MVALVHSLESSVLRKGLIWKSCCAGSRARLLQRVLACPVDSLHRRGWEFVARLCAFTPSGGGTEGGREETMKKADARLGGPAAGAASSAAGTDSASRLSALFLQRVVLVRDDLRANSCGGDVFVCLQTLKAWQLLDGCLRLLKVEDALDGEPSTLRAAGEDRVKAERLGGDGEGRAEERDAVPAPPAAAVVTVRCWEEFARGARPGRSLRREEMLVSPDVWEALSFPENLRQVSVRLWLERLREAPRPCVEAELRLLRICPPQRQNQNQDRNSAAAAPSPPPSWLAAVVERSAKNAQSSAKSRATRKDAPRNRAELLADSFIRFLRLALRNRCFVEKQPLQTRIGGLCCLLEPSVVDPAPSEEAIDRGGPQRAVCTAGDALSSASSSPGVEAKSPEPSSPSEQQVRVWRVSSDCRFRVSLSMKASTSFPPTHRKLAEPTDSPRGFARYVRLSLKLEGHSQPGLRPWWACGNVGAFDGGWLNWKGLGCKCSDWRAARARWKRWCGKCCCLF